MFRRSDGVVYLHTDGELFKVGESSRSGESRRRSHQTGNGRPITEVGSWPSRDRRAVERAAQDLLAPWATKGGGTEWYACSKWRALMAIRAARGSRFSPSFFLAFLGSTAQHAVQVVGRWMGRALMITGALQMIEWFLWWRAR